jgi:hypothetical protein
MDEHEQRLTGLSEPLAGVDLTPSGGWVAVSAYGPEQFVYFNGFRLPVPVPCRFPIVRAISDNQLILADSRAPRPQKNAWIIHAEQGVTSHFRAGDAIADIIPFETSSAITYFDEAFGSGEALDGMVVFDFTGRQRFHFSAVDCYCACALSRSRLLALFYPDFPIVLFDLTTDHETRWRAPAQLAGASAITAAGDIAFFHGTYHDHRIVQRWRIGATDVEAVGEYSGPLRGIRDGRFIATGEAGYTIVSFSDMP